MLFSSVEFLIFLGATVAFFYWLINTSFRGRQLSFLVLASLFFYAWWNPVYLALLLCSIGCNYIIGYQIAMTEGKRRRFFFLTGIVGNLLALGYYKYMDFFIRTLNEILPIKWACPEITLPLGISFFTFQQIAFLSDIYTGKLNRPGALQSYALFICFFPQLIAGPIVHHAEMMPQFDKGVQYPDWRNLYNGVLLLILGLGKKVLLADSLAPISKATFDTGLVLSFWDAVFGTLSYSLQLYFDFSGYSDMAMGCALLFNIRLPENFRSPYKAVSIQDFWHRWHITLSEWLRNYLYIPLGGNRRGEKRTLLNLGLTFLLGGLWHGAAWTFVIWGALHGAGLIVHRLWIRHVRWHMPSLLGWGITFLFVCLAWIAFRAPSFNVMGQIYESLLGVNGFAFSSSFRYVVASKTGWGLFPFEGVSMFVLLCLAVVLLCPSTLSLLRPFGDSPAPSWKKTGLGLCIGCAVAVLLVFPQRIQDFIYFQF